MARKLKGGLREQEESFIDKLKGAGHQLFLAGLGAVAKTMEDGPKLFETLIAKGMEINQRTNSQPQSAAAKSKTTDHWDTLEQVFEDRVSRTLKRLSVPTQEDIQALQRQLQALSDTVESLKSQAPRSGSGNLPKP